jgi:hypothetical protein
MLTKHVRHVFAKLSILLLNPEKIVQPQNSRYHELLLSNPLVKYATNTSTTVQAELHTYTHTHTSAKRFRVASLSPYLGNL